MNLKLKKKNKISSEQVFSLNPDLYKKTSFGHSLPFKHNDSPPALQPIFKIIQTKQRFY